MMDHFFIVAGILLLVAIAMVFIRLIIGPTVMDRLVAVNMIGTKSTILLIVIGIIFNRVDMFVDIAIGYGLLNFIASIGASKYFMRHKKLHPEDKWKGQIQHDS